MCMHCGYIVLPHVRYAVTSLLHQCMHVCAYKFMGDVLIYLITMMTMYVYAFVCNVGT